MAKRGWRRESARHSLAARGIPTKCAFKRVVTKKTWVEAAKQQRMPVDRLEEMLATKAESLIGKGCEHCREVIAEAKKQHRNVVFNWDGFHAVALGKKRSALIGVEIPTKSWAGPMRTDSGSVYYRKRHEGMSDVEAREFVLENAPWEMSAYFEEDIPLEPASLGRGGHLVPQKSVTASEVRAIVSDARFDINPYARTYIDALSDSEGMYGEHGVEVQAAYIATNLRAKTPEQKEAKKLLQRIADGKYTGKKVVR